MTLTLGFYFTEKILYHKSYYGVAQKFYSVLEEWHIDLPDLGAEVISDKCQTH